MLSALLKDSSLTQDYLKEIINMQVACATCEKVYCNKYSAKAHEQGCLKLLIKRKLYPPSETGDDQRERECPRCDEVITGDQEFEMHMVIAHQYHWILNFDSEDEFLAWFKAEGLDEVMQTCRHPPSFTTRCVVNDCPCRILVKQVSNGSKALVAQYHVLHNHPERHARQTVTGECRHLIRKLLGEGKSNQQVFEAVRAHFPESSVNYKGMSLAKVRAFRCRMVAKMKGIKRNNKRRTQQARDDAF